MKMARVRKFRHWKQQFNKDAAFVWRKSLLYGKGYTKIGGKIPKDLAADRNRLRRFWEAGVIELAEFKDPQNILQPAGDEVSIVDKPEEGDVIDGPKEGGVTQGLHELDVTPELQKNRNKPKQKNIRNT
jgi:hypothetical protein